MTIQNPNSVSLGRFIFNIFSFYIRVVLSWLDILDRICKTDINAPSIDLVCLCLLLSYTKG